MRTIAVIGATGTVGRHVVTALQAAGGDVRALSRHSGSHPVDVTTGEGMEPALAGCEVVVDAANGSSRRPGPVIVDGTRRTLHLARAAGVGHVVCVSIVGIEHVPAGYYRAKVAQERLVREAGVPWTIVRSTQFHELVDGLLDALGRRHLTPRTRARLQPVAAEEAGRAVAGVALGAPRHSTVSVAGPAVQELSDLAREWAEQRHVRALPLPIPLAGRMGAALAGGALTCADPDERGTMRFREWLATRR